jgi:hypothetical protein
MKISGSGAPERGLPAPSSHSHADPAHAQLPLGAPAPAYSKSLLGGGTLTNTTYSGKVVVMFLLGYG